MSAFYEKILDYQKQGKVYVMADLGSNYKSKEDLKNAIWLAKAMKIDAIKYQYFTQDELYGPSAVLNEKFPLKELSEEARLKEIDFLCTAFSPEGYQEMDKYVDAHKVASSEMNHFRILQKLKELKKPVIISTGAHAMPDVARSLEFLKEGDTNEIIVMHANSKYPAKFSDIEKFKSVKGLAPGPVGYSDHTLSIDVVPQWFKDNGVSVYEKHWNPFNYTDTPDAVQSLDSEEFRVLTARLHNEVKAYTEENDARFKFIRRVVATKEIKAGDVLSEGVNIGIYRSKDGDAKGTNPFNIVKLEGRIAANDLKPFEGVSIGDTRV